MNSAPIPPLLIHCPRGVDHASSNLFFKHVVPKFVRHCQSELSPAIEVITYNNGDAAFPIEDQMKRLGIRYHVLAKTVRPWKWSAKLTEVHEFLKGRRSTAELFMLVDGNDTVFTRFPRLDEVNALFSSYCPNDIVFCATPANWPAHATCNRFENWRYPGPDRHLSSGAFIGRREALLKASEWISSRIRAGVFDRAGGICDDQLAWRLAHFAAPVPIGIDYRGVLFKRCGKWLLKANLA